MEWVDWYNNRPHSQLDYIPPEEYEARYYASNLGVPAGDVSTMKQASNRDGLSRSPR
jgi:hypothetical protein